MENARSIVKLRGSHSNSHSAHSTHTPTDNWRHSSLSVFCQKLDVINGDDDSSWKWRTPPCYTSFNFRTLLSRHRCYHRRCPSSTKHAAPFLRWARKTARARFANAKFGRTLKNKETKCDTKFEEDKNMKIKLINRISRNFRTIVVFSVCRRLYSYSAVPFNV